MNRLEMAEQIAKRVPMLSKRDKQKWQSAEMLRAGFVRDYPITRIGVLTLDEYVIGKGSSNRSFCYRLEREMDSLGRILGATAFKFGVYFGRIKSDPLEQYRFASRWGNNKEDAFSSVERAIVDLLKAARLGDSHAIEANPLSPMFKGKLLFVYYPAQFAPVYSEKHLNHFISELDLGGSLRCGADMQRALMEYRATWPQLTAQPALLYMRLLYDVFGYPPDSGSQTAVAVSVPLLDKAVAGAEFIQDMPPVNPERERDSEDDGNPDYGARHKRLKRIGDRGEAIVVALEKKRLIQAGRPELADRIERVSEADDMAGYDVLSFDDDGTKRPIEVKATSAENLDRGFYLSSNELQKASALTNYHIYLVFSTMGKKPRILPLKQPDLNGPNLKLSPVVYHVSLPENGVET